MQYVCSKCGEYFDKPQELKNMGGDIGESVFVCPYCGCEEYEEVIECDICGEIVPEYDSREGVCEKCLERLAGKKHADGLGEKNYTYIRMNGFLASFFSDEEVAKLLKKERMAIYDNDELEEKGREYCLSDRWDFANYLKKEGVCL